MNIMYAVFIKRSPKLKIIFGKFYYVRSLQERYELKTQNQSCIFLQVIYVYHEDVEVWVEFL